MKKKLLTLSSADFDSHREAEPVLHFEDNLPSPNQPREHAFTDSIEHYSEYNPATFGNSGEEEKMQQPPSFFPSDNVSEASSQDNAGGRVSVAHTLPAVANPHFQSDYKEENTELLKTEPAFNSPVCSPSFIQPSPIAEAQKNGIIVVRRFQCYDPGSLLAVNSGLSSYRSQDITLGEEVTNRTDESISTGEVDTQEDSDYGSNELPAINYTIEGDNLTIEGENFPKNTRTFLKLKQMAAIRKNPKDNIGPHDSPTPPPAMLHSMLSGTLQEYEEVPSTEETKAVKISSFYQKNKQIEESEEEQEEEDEEESAGEDDSGKRYARSTPRDDPERAARSTPSWMNQTAPIRFEQLSEAESRRQYEQKLVVNEGSDDSERKDYSQDVVHVGEIIQFEEFNADCNHDTEGEEEVKEEKSHRSRNNLVLQNFPSKEILIIQEMKPNVPQSARQSNTAPPHFIASPQKSITPKVMKKTFDFQVETQQRPDIVPVNVKRVLDQRGEEVNFLSPPHITNNYNFNLRSDSEQKLTQQQLQTLFENQVLEKRSLELKMSVKQEQISIMETRNQELEALNESLSQRIEAMNQEFRILSQQEEAKREALLIQEENATMVEELKEMLEGAKQVASENQKSNIEMKMEAEQLKDEREVYRRENERLESELASVKEQMMEKTRFIERYKRELLQIKELMTKMEPSSHDQTAHISKLKQALEQSENKRRECELHMHQTLKCAEDLKMQLLKKIEKVKNLKAERENLKTEIIKMKQVFSNKCDSYRSQKNRLNKKINDRDATIAALQQKLRFYETEHQKQFLLGSLAGARTTGNTSTSPIQMLLAATAIDDDSPTQPMITAIENHNFSSGISCSSVSQSQPASITHFTSQMGRMMDKGYNPGLMTMTNELRQQLEFTNGDISSNKPSSFENTLHESSKGPLVEYFDEEELKLELPMHQNQNMRYSRHEEVGRDLKQLVTHKLDTLLKQVKIIDSKEDREQLKRLVKRKGSGSVGDLWRDQRLLFLKKKDISLHDERRSEFSSRTASPIGPHHAYPSHTSLRPQSQNSNYSNHPLPPRPSVQKGGGIQNSYVESEEEMYPGSIISGKPESYHQYHKHSTSLGEKPDQDRMTIVEPLGNTIALTSKSVLHGKKPETRLSNESGGWTHEKNVATVPSNPSSQSRILGKQIPGMHDSDNNILTNTLQGLVRLVQNQTAKWGGSLKNNAKTSSLSPTTPTVAIQKPAIKKKAMKSKTKEPAQKKNKELKVTNNLRGFTPPANNMRGQNERKSSISSHHSTSNSHSKKVSYGRVYERHYENKTLSKYIAEQAAKRQLTPNRSFHPELGSNPEANCGSVGKGMASRLNPKLNQSTTTSHSTTTAFSAIDSQLKKLKEKWAPKKLNSVAPQKRQQSHGWSSSGNRHPLRPNDSDPLLGGSSRLKGVTRLSPTPALVSNPASRIHTHSSVNEMSPRIGEKPPKSKKSDQIL